MKKYKYLIIGGGMAANSAVDGIRELDGDGSILVISSESDLPYKRPQLSKKLWTGGKIEDIWSNIEEKGADVILKTRAQSINQVEKTISTEKGELYGYEKLLLATGGKVRRLPFGEDVTHYYRNLNDYYALKKLTEHKNRFAIIGSGFVGSEIAAALALNGMDVSLIDLGTGIGWNIFPPSLVEYLNAYYRAKGVTVITGKSVQNIYKDGKGVVIEFEGDGSLAADVVVAGIGIAPNIELAELTGLKINNGIEVDEFLRTSDLDIYAAGDVANFFNPALGQRVRMEHADNAKAMGRAAGRNMAGAGECYDYLPLFYSDLFDLGYEAVGLLNSQSEIVEEWQTQYEKGVLYYLQDERVRGILLWNVWDQVDAAREVIAMPAPVDPSKLIGRIR